MKPLTPRTLDWIDHAPLAVTRRRHIAAPPEAVWEVIADHAEWPAWFGGLESVDPGHPATGVGGTRTVHLKGLSVSEEFLAWDPGERFAFTATGVTRAVVRALVERVDLVRESPTSTSVSYTMAVDPVGGRLTAVVLRPAIGRVVAQGLAGLARIAESDG